MSDLINIEDFKTFWERNPIVIIDSCSLLDLYRYAPKPAKSILENLKKIEDNIWIPNQVFKEYKRNKLTVINKANSKYEQVTKDVLLILQQAEKNISNKFHRYGKFNYEQIQPLKKQLETDIINLKKNTENFKKEVLNEIKVNKEALKKDEVYEFIQHLKKEQQIGMSFSLQKMIEIYSEGEIRYNHLIPPGYEDIIKDKEDKTKTEKFGDLIIWKELLQKAKKDKRPIIFITDDVKDDWWNIKRTNSNLGETTELIEPRPELVSEFNEISEIEKDAFLMLTLPEFNKHISVINDVEFKERYLIDLELEPENVISEIIEAEEWALIIDKEGSLTHEFIHGGELQELTGEILTDVDINEVSDPEFDNLYVDYDEDIVLIEADFICEGSINIETRLSKELDHRSDAKVNLSGNITINFKISYDEETHEIRRHDENINISNVEISEYKQISNEIDYSDICCIICEKNIGSYFTNEGEKVCSDCLDQFDYCPGCGKLFPKDSIGSYKCDSCIRNED